MKIYNTLTNKKEEFKPIKAGHVHMYVCGPTVYDFCHLGHARAYVAFDVIRRYLEYQSFKVLYVENFTDVDDKIINRANEAGEDPVKLAEKFTQEYFRDMDALGVRRADIHPKVSKHIPDIIEVIQGLIKKGYAYEMDGSVYFEVGKFKSYGKLSGQSLKKIKSGARIEVDEKKKNPADFALWKKAKPGEPSWDSPWGKGRPGWHIECSVMSMKYLGPTLDIHGGGQDLIFPHHENEIAQSEAYSGKQFARYWMHNGFVKVNREKMSKSLGNFFTIKEILDKYRPEVVRFFLLSTSYRSPIDFSDEHLTQAEGGLGRILNTIEYIEHHLTAGKKEKLTAPAKKVIGEIERSKKKFIAAMDDDFNTTLAVAALFDIAKTMNVYMGNAKLNSEVLRAGLDAFEELGKILGLFEQRKKAELPDSEIKALVDLRQQARKGRDFKTADRIRSDLAKLGIILEDQKDGTIRWKKA